MRSKEGMAANRSLGSSEMKLRQNSPPTSIYDPH